MQDFALFISHHSELAYAFAGLMALLTLVEFIRLRRLNFSVTPAEAVSLINRENGVVIDIRDKEAYGQGHILDAISLTTQDTAEAVKKLDKYRTKPLIIVCYTGTSAQKMALSLSQKGFRAHALAGGIPSWVAHELPLIKR